MPLNTSVSSLGNDDFVIILICLMKILTYSAFLRKKKQTIMISLNSDYRNKSPQEKPEIKNRN